MNFYKGFFLSISLLPLLKAFVNASSSCVDDGYLLYVWTSAFDPNAAHCNGVYPENDDGDNATCFNHSWETEEARNRLWASCSVSGREVTRILVEDVKNRIENDGLNADEVCDPTLTILLREAHDRGIAVYALFSASNEEFSEQRYARYPNQFNENCGDDEVYFDGVAVNNEYFSTIKDCNDDTDENDINVAAQQTHLDRLQSTVDNASPVPVHFSVSWNWDCCSCSSDTYATRELLWPVNNGVTQSVLKHMVEIVDSVDVQVAYNTPSAMSDRTDKTYQYWLAATNNGATASSTSKVYSLAYTNPTELCQMSFSPHVKGSEVAEDVCDRGADERTETAMFDAFDFVESDYPLSKGGIHYMSGVYGSGITDDWPVHQPSPSSSCLTARPSISPTVITDPPTKSPVVITDPPTKSPTKRKPCYDNHRRFIYQEDKVTCKWVWYHIDEGSCKVPELRKQCPITCAEEECGCTDKTWPFIVNKKKRKWCQFIRKKNTKKRCNKLKLRSFCPDTCVCNPPFKK